MMRKISILRITLVILLLVIAGIPSVSANPDDCAAKTDADLVKAIKEKLSAKYESQMNHINVHVQDHEVFLEGWVTTEKIKKDIEKIVKKVKCVKKINNNLKIGVGGGCDLATQKPCGDICIPKNQTCNIGKGN